MIKGLHENNSMIMSDSPVEYLRDDNFHLIVILFTTTFNYNYMFYRDLHDNVYVFYQINHKPIRTALIIFHSPVNTLLIYSKINLSHPICNIS